MALTVDEPNFLDNVLHYGLFLGALFQLVCIFAVIVLPKSDYEEERNEGEEDVKDQSSGRSPLQAHSHQQLASSKKYRKEKKKHR
ncbi:hypothetical protein ACJMK2_016089 [Sinanodonta woodiana]|uniref:Protein anon-73B1 n=1 Tax=Sinanodonta woodiana TaxID=1069815 RepID=A0ABD3USR6_SINWO